MSLSQYIFYKPEEALQMAKRAVDRIQADAKFSTF